MQQCHYERTRDVFSSFFRPPTPHRFLLLLSLFPDLQSFYQFFSRSDVSNPLNLSLLSASPLIVVGWRAELSEGGKAQEGIQTNSRIFGNISYHFWSSILASVLHNFSPPSSLLFLCRRSEEGIEVENLIRTCTHVVEEGGYRGFPYA